MIGTILLILLFMLMSVVLAGMQSHDNAATIHAGPVGTMHLQWGLIRTGLFTVASLLCMVFMKGPFWQWVALAGGTGIGLYSFALRRMLNHRMGWDRHYLGSTAWYDLLALHLGTGYSIKWLKAYHQQYVRQNSYYFDLVKSTERDLSRIECMLFTLVGILVFAIIHLQHIN